MLDLILKQAFAAKQAAYQFTQTYWIIFVPFLCSMLCTILLGCAFDEQFYHKLRKPSY